MNKSDRFILILLMEALLPYLPVVVVIGVILGALALLRACAT